MKECIFEEIMSYFTAAPESIVHALKEVFVKGTAIKEVSETHFIDKTLLSAYVLVFTSTYNNDYPEVFKSTHVACNQSFEGLMTSLK